jgi:uncharacterized membrane protein
MATFSSSSPGAYNVTITGSSGSLSHSTTIAVTVRSVGSPDFKLFTNAGIVDIQAGNSYANWITIEPNDGFSGIVTLSASVYPAGPTTTFSSSTIFGGSGTSIMTIDVGRSVAAGTYTVIVQATSGKLAHSESIIMIATPFQDITVTPSVSSLSFNTGSSGIATIIVAAQNGFTGTISFLVVSLGSLSCVPSSTTIQSSGSITLKCSTNTAGNYTVWIRITGAPVVHSATIFVHVSAVSAAAPAPLTILGFVPVVFYGIIAATIVVVVAGTVLVLRTRRSASNPS